MQRSVLTGMIEAVCTVDFETRSFVNVKFVGAWRYAEDITTEILFMSWKIGNKATRLWSPWFGMPFPQEVIDHIAANGMFEAHNVQFERAIWTHIVFPQYGVNIPRRWKDTLAVCAYRGLPLGLDFVGKALNLAVQKDKYGKYLLNTLSTPKWGTKAEPDRVYREDFDLMMDLGEYCVQDTDAEVLLSHTLGDLPYAEYALWTLDQRINQRGVMLDMDAVEAARDIIHVVEQELNSELQIITEGAVMKATQRDKLLAWFKCHGLPTMNNLQKVTIEELLVQDKSGRYIRCDDIPKGTLRALNIRQQLSKSSTKKLEKMVDTVSRDSRVRGLLQYHGASTGRWAGRLVQPQNFPRALFKEDMDKLIELIKEKDYHLLDLLYGNAMNAIATSLRGMFIAAPDHVFRVCDFSAVEARVTFWLAGCQAGLDVFAKSDRGESEDIYCVTASDLVGFEVKKALHNHERQLGKITVLGCGYQMGWPKLQFQAEKDYGVVLTDAEAKNMVDLYRTKYAEVKQFWADINEAAITTVKTGHPHSIRGITYQVEHDNAGTWLSCKLPNDRKIWYYEPVIEYEHPPWCTSEERKDPKKMMAGLTYMGRDNKRGGNWDRVRTYGGMLTENVVQAVARDLMVEAMFRVENEGYRIVMTIHDEIISEDLATFGSQKEFEELMSITPPWATGCPVAVEGGEITRYQKI